MVVVPESSMGYRKDEVNPTTSPQYLETDLYNSLVDTMHVYYKLYSRMLDNIILSSTFTFIARSLVLTSKGYKSERCHT